MRRLVSFKKKALNSETPTYILAQFTKLQLGLLPVFFSKGCGLDLGTKGIALNTAL